jgi:alpha-L-fucosidase 2
MVFGQPAREHLQFNDITLWTGDDKVMGAYQPFGDLSRRPARPRRRRTEYHRSLDLARASTVTYEKGGARFRREAWASNPAQVIVLRLTADRPGQYSGAIELGDRHGAHIAAANKRLYRDRFAGRLAAAGRRREDRPEHEHDELRQPGAGAERRRQGQRRRQAHRVQGCDALTLVLGAGTSYVLDAARHFQGEHPLARVTAQVTPPRPGRRPRCWPSTSATSPA